MAVHGRVAAVVGLLVEIGPGRGIALYRRSVRYFCPRRPPRPLRGDRVQEWKGARHALWRARGSGLGVQRWKYQARSRPFIRPSPGLAGVVNAFGEPIDGKGALPLGARAPLPIRNNLPRPHARQRLGGKVDLGVKAMNTFLTCCKGQRWEFSPARGLGNQRCSP